MITRKDRYFGEGTSAYGEECPVEAFRKHRRAIRVKRLVDLLGEEPKLSCSQVEQRFEEICAAIEAADIQVFSDNAELVERHGIK